MIKAYKGGDRGALAELVRRYFDRLEKHGQRICSNREDAEEVMQETFATAIDTLDGFRGEASLKNWLFKIASSLCMKKNKYKREEAGHLSYDNPSDMPSPTGDASFISPDRLIEDDQLLRLLEGALVKIPEGMRDAVRLVDFQGMSIDEAAKTLGISEDTIRVRLHRGRQKIRTSLSKK